MRYQDWDVLLFPSETKIPLQEFRTGCYAVFDNEPNYEDFQSSSAGRHQIRQYPTMHTFVPSQPTNTPFRVSLHCWQTPELSPAQKAHVEQGRVAAFEARVVIDGEVSGVDVNEVSCDGESSWPRIVESSICKPLYELITNPHDLQEAVLDKFGDPEHYLYWPKFHEQVLQELQWNAADLRGRVRVIINEGFKHERTNASPFIRLKTLVAFSFQHAPLHNLENSNIAWPNRQMWTMSQLGYWQNFSPCRAPNPELMHGHTPDCRQVSGSSSSDAMSVDPFSIGRLAPPPPPPPYTAAAVAPQQSAIMPWTEARAPWQVDPFVDARRSGMQRGTDQTDASMPDYQLQRYGGRLQHASQGSAGLYQPGYAQSVNSSRHTSGDHISGSSMHGFMDGTMNRLHAMFPQIGTGAADSTGHEAAQIMVETPLRSPHGIRAPSNTRVNSNLSTPLSNKSAEATSEVRGTSGQLQESIERAVVAEEEAQPAAEMKPPQKSRPRIRNVSNTVKSRKEGKSKPETTASHVDQRKASYGNELSNDQENPSSTESKRKRSFANVNGETRPLTRSIAMMDTPPMRKVSKTMGTSEASNHSNVSTPDGGVKIMNVRDALGELHNL